MVLVSPGDSVFGQKGETAVDRAMDIGRFDITFKNRRRGRGTTERQGEGSTRGQGRSRCEEGCEYMGGTRSHANKPSIGSAM